MAADSHLDEDKASNDVKSGDSPQGRAAPAGAGGTDGAAPAPGGADGAASGSGSGSGSGVYGGKEAACDLFKATGDEVMLKRHKCPGAGSGATGSLKTIAFDPGRGKHVDDQITETLNYVMLSLLLFVALVVIIFCCCQMYGRIVSRRLALRDDGRRGGQRRAVTNRTVYSSGGTGCCGGTGGGASAYSYKSSYRSTMNKGAGGGGMRGLSMYDPQCHDCGSLNMI